MAKRKPPAVSSALGGRAWVRFRPMADSCLGIAAGEGGPRETQGRERGLRKDVAFPRTPPVVFRDSVFPCRRACCQRRCEGIPQEVPKRRHRAGCKQKPAMLVWGRTRFGPTSLFAKKTRWYRCCLAEGESPSDSARHAYSI